MLIILESTKLYFLIQGTFWARLSFPHLKHFAASNTPKFKNMYLSKSYYLNKKQMKFV